MKEHLRQIKMGWNRGFQLGLVAGGISILIVGGLIVGFLFGGAFFSKDVEHEIVEVEVRVELTNEQQKVLDDFEAEKEKIKEEEYQKHKEEFEASRTKWLKDNPPVKDLWDGSQRDLEYTISYIRENWYHGDCALAWRLDVICWGFGGNKLVFPIERPEN